MLDFNRICFACGAKQLPTRYARRGNRRPQIASGTDPLSVARVHTDEWGTWGALASIGRWRRPQDTRLIGTWQVVGSTTRSNDGRDIQIAE